MKRTYCAIGLSLMLIGITLPSYAVKLKDLLVYLPMNEGKGTDVGDASGNGFNGAIFGGGGKWIDGKFGKGLELTAAEEVQIKDAPPLDGVNGFTIGLWVFQAQQQNTGLLQKGTDWPDVSYLLQPWSDGQIYFGVNVTDSRAITKAGTHPTGKWYHVAGTFDGSSLKVFINGTLEAEAPSPVKKAPDTNSPILIGNRFEGKVDEFVMYSRALSKDEIKAVFENDFLAVEAHGKLATTWGKLKSGF